MRGFIFIILLVPSLLLADSGWTSTGKVVEIIADSDIRFRVKLSVENNPSQCKSSKWFYRDYLSSGSQQMYSTLLEALTNNMRVKVYVNGKCGLKGYSEISAVSILAK
jgi:hypothetical protein